MQSNDSAIIWAHRGRNRLAPENTMTAFRLAMEAGDAGIELDVTLSADGIPVVIHDDRVDRTTDGSGLVSELSYEELNRLDAGSWFDDRFKGEHLPLLSDILKEARGHIFVNIEIVAPLARQLSWSHFLILIPIKSEEKRLFYAKKSIEASWGKRELKKQIERKVYERTEIVDIKLSTDNTQMQHTFKDPYFLDFLLN